MARPSILIITYTSPFPPTDGGKVSVFGTVNFLRAHVDITLVYPLVAEEEKEHLEILKANWPEVRLEPISFLQEEEQNSTIEFLRTLFQAGKTGVKKMLGIPEPGADPLERYAVNDIVPKKFVDRVGELLQDRSYDIIQVEYTRFFSLVHIFPEASKKVYVQVESKHMILDDHFTQNNDRSTYAEYLLKHTKFLELGIMKRYDKVIVFSDDDREVLKNEMDAAKIAVSPYPAIGSINAIENFQPQKLLFIGGQAHRPNEDGLTWFMESVYPAIQLTGLQVHVTGEWTEEYQEKYPGIIFTGFVNDLAELAANSIVIVPIRLGGGGIRSKVLQAMGMGLPVVSTSAGCYGVKGKSNNVNIMIANDAESFAKAIEGLVTDAEKGKRIGESAAALIKEYYSEKAAGETRLKIYNSLLQNSAVAL